MASHLLAVSGALAGPKTVFVVMIAVLILLAVRVIVGIFGLAITRRVANYVDAAIGIFFLLFIFVVVSRFRYLA